MSIRRFTLANIMLVMLVSPAVAAPLNPIVDLNTGSASNFVLTNSDTRVQVWKDAAAAVGGEQNFGQDVADHRPEWLVNQVMPNGSITNLVNFRGGDRTRGQSGNDNTRIDFLTSGTFDGTNFTDGPDTNYIMPAISWFTVIRSTNNLTTRQELLATAYGYTNQGVDDPNGTFATVTGIWGSVLIDSAADGDTTVNFQGNAGGTNSGASLAGSNAALNTWYIIGNVWDPVVETISMTVLQPNTLTQSTIVDNLTIPTDAPALTNGGYAMSDAINHHLRIGGQGGSAGSHASREFNGQMAELLIYNSALSAAEFNQVLSYLDHKYFIIPEPSTAVLLCMACLPMLRCRRRAK